MMFWISIAFVILFYFIYTRLRKRNEHFKNLNIPGPEPQLIFGNLLQMMKKPCMHDAIKEWTQKYGKVFGYFEGGTPVLMISDPDMVHDILLKKFSMFNARKALPIQPDPETDKNIHMFLARGHRWKRLRAIANPTFSASKLKQMSRPMQEAIDSLMKRIDSFASADQPFDIYPMYQSLTLDVISRCAFGFESDCQINEDDEFLKLCKQVFTDTVKLNLVNYFAIFFPELTVIWRKISFGTDRIRKNPFVFLEDKLRQVLEYRKTSSQPNVATKPNDLLQLLLDSEAPDYELRSADLTGPSANGSSGEPIKLDKRMHPEEVISTCILFMLAGYETTSTALAYVTHLLALNPEVQEKLQNEIDDLNKTSSASMESIVKAPYLDMVISEALRMYPIAQPIEGRTCLQTCTVGDLTVKTGDVVCVDVWTLHYDPNLWGPDVDLFRPERFLPEESEHRHPMAWLPFGAGPRNCIGMRFALMEAKLTLARILQNYTIRKCSSTEIPLELCEGATCTPKNGIRIKLESRKIKR